MTFTRRRLLVSLVTTATVPALLRQAGAKTPAGPSAGRARPALRAHDSTRSIDADGAPVRLWTYNDSFPGPLLRVAQGEVLSLRLDNFLPQPTSLHWTGARIPNATDGVAGLTGIALAPGAGQDIAFTVREAGTFIYRPMVPEHAAEQVERGLSGILIVEEETPTYADDFVLVLDDIALGDDGQVRGDFDTATDRGLAGRLGNRLLVNGLTTPERIVRRPGQRVRVRIANTANARPLTLGFDNVAVHIIAADSQPVDDPFPPSQDRLTLVPGSRVDIVLTTPGAGATGAIVARIGAGLPLLQLAGEGAPVTHGPANIAALAANPLLPESIDLARARRFDIVVSGGLDPQRPQLRPADGARIWALGGVSWTDAGDRPLFRVPRNTPVVLALANPTPFLQVLHLHGHHARQLHRLDDGWEPYWVDTFAIRPTETVRIAFIADNPGRWMIGSAVLDRLAAGLAGWFEVD